MPTGARPRHTSRPAAAPVGKPEDAAPREACPLWKAESHARITEFTGELVAGAAQDDVPVWNRPRAIRRRLEESMDDVHAWSFGSVM